MDDIDITCIFCDLKKLGYINRIRKIQTNRLLSLECCNFTAHSPPFRFEKINKMVEFIYNNLFRLPYNPYYINYDRQMSEFLNEYDIRWILLHEEGHLRFYVEHLRWDDDKIEKIPPYNVDNYQQNEYNADKYAAKIFIKEYPEIKAFNVMQSVFCAHCYCVNSKLKNSLKNMFRRWFFPSSHPPRQDRINKIKEFYEMMDGIKK